VPAQWSRVQAVPLTTVRIPDGVDETKDQTKALMTTISRSAPRGSAQGKVWRIGLMGYNASGQRHPAAFSGWRSA
jgi:aspartate aminotransferase-like enzyme